MARRLVAVLALVPGALSPAAARPISYEGGWTVIEETDRTATAAVIHYTIDPSLSVGVRSEWDRKSDYLLNAVQATYLVKRWFGSNYQANIYAFAGAGAAMTVGDRPDALAPAGFAGVMADWETRRWFVSYEAHGLAAGEVEEMAMQSGRLGVAPYIGDTGALHTWLMVEIDHRPENPDPVGVTPLVRFFKGPALLELGWSVTDDEPLVNFTYRF